MLETLHIYRRNTHPLQDRSARAFTLLESLLATGIVLIIVIAVTSAVTAGQQHGYEARQHISGTLAAEEMMGRLLAVHYDDLWMIDGYTEPAGMMVDMHGQPFPSSFAEIGRSVEVSPILTITPPGMPDVTVVGRNLRVTAFDAKGNDLADLRRFVPYPSAALSGDAPPDVLSSLN